MADILAEQSVQDQPVRPSLVWSYRNFLLGALAVAVFFPAWQAIFLIVPLNPLFMTTPSLIAQGYVDMVESGDLANDLAVSAVPFFLGLGAAVLVGVPL